MFKTIVKALCEARGYDEAMNPFIEEGIRRMEEDQGIEWSKERRQVARAAQVALLLGRNSMVRSEEGFGQAMQDNAGGRQPGDWDHYRLTWDGQMILLPAIIAKVAEAIGTDITVRVDYVSGELGSGDQGVGSRRSFVASTGSLICRTSGPLYTGTWASWARRKLDNSSGAVVTKGGAEMFWRATLNWDNGRLSRGDAHCVALVTSRDRVGENRAALRLIHESTTTLSEVRAQPELILALRHEKHARGRKAVSLSDRMDTFILGRNRSLT